MNQKLVPKEAGNSTVLTLCSGFMSASIMTVVYDPYSEPSEPRTDLAFGRNSKHLPSK